LTAGAGGVDTAAGAGGVDTLVGARADRDDAAEPTRVRTAAAGAGDETAAAPREPWVDAESRAPDAVVRVPPVSAAATAVLPKTAAPTPRAAARVATRPKCNISVIRIRPSVPPACPVIERPK
jgi:hypothetical protein